MAEPAPDYEKLVEYFRALAYPTRLELLHILRFPHALPDIRLAPRQSREGQNPERVVARQTVQEHLDKLMEIGIVAARDADGAGRGRREFVVNGPRIYQMMEELRRVGTVVVGPPLARDATVDSPVTGSGAMDPGPKLVLVHGLLEGKAFPLRRADLHGDGRGWVIGRKAGLQVSVDYDPYVSLENSEVVEHAGAYALLDLRGSRNGTLLNWRPLATDERAPLAAGDVIGVGRSLFVFRPT